jgi:hypothetical protein
MAVLGLVLDALPRHGARVLPFFICSLTASFNLRVK